MFTLYVVLPGATAPGYHRLGICRNVSGREHFLKGVIKRAIDSAQLRARGVSSAAIQKTINAVFTAGPGTTVYFYAGRCTSRRPVERNRKYRWPQSSHRNGLIRRSAHTILSSVPFLWDLRTQLPPHRGQMLCSAECRKLIKPPSFQGLGGADSVPLNLKRRKYRKLCTWRGFEVSRGDEVIATLSRKEARNPCCPVAKLIATLPNSSDLRAESPLLPHARKTGGWGRLLLTNCPCKPLSHAVGDVGLHALEEEQPPN
jgi:hypothetical protein